MSFFSSRYKVGTDLAGGGGCKLFILNDLRRRIGNESTQPALRTDASGLRWPAQSTDSIVFSDMGGEAYQSALGFVKGTRAVAPADSRVRPISGTMGGATDRRAARHQGKRSCPTGTRSGPSERSSPWRSP